jgi:hypothetical protein
MDRGNRPFNYVNLNIDKKLNGELEDEFDERITFKDTKGRKKYEKIPTVFKSNKSRLM